MTGVEQIELPFDTTVGAAEINKLAGLAEEWVGGALDVNSLEEWVFHALYCLERSPHHTTSAERDEVIRRIARAADNQTREL